MMSYNDFSQKRVKRVKQLFEKYQTFSSSKEQLNNTVEMHEKNLGVKITEFNKLKRESQTVEYEFGEIESNSLKKKIVEITEEHKAVMALNSKTMNSIVTMHGKALEDKTKELEVAKSTNLSLSKKIQELESVQTLRNKENSNTSESVSESSEKKIC